MKHPWYARLVALALTLVITFELLPTRICPILCPILVPNCQYFISNYPFSLLEKLTVSSSSFGILSHSEG